jgi:arabinogalactan oligomer/maltooligosaccharide transport system substrate-binding protein
LEVYEGQLYLVVQNYDTGLEVWRTANGTDWEQVGFAGFGDNLNIWSYWDNATTVFSGSLYIATNHAYTGGEVWRMVQHRAYLPLVAKGYIPTVITLWHQWPEGYWQEYQDIIEEFNSSHPDMAVRLVHVDDMDNALAAAIPAGTGPDIVSFANDPIGRWASAGNLAPLDPWIDLSYLTANFEPVAVEAMIWDEQIWGIPDTQEGIALVYNRDLISHTQVPAPDDWDGLLTEAAQFRQSHPDQFYLCNWGLGSADAAYAAAPIYFDHGLSEYGGYVDEGGAVYMTTTVAISAAHWICDFRPYAPAETSYEICKNMLFSGEAAIWWTGPWAIPDLQQAGIDYGIAPMGSPFVGVRLYLLTSNAVDRGNAEAAIDVIKYLGSAEVQRRLTLANRTIPTNTAALNDPDVQALYEIAQFGASVNLGTPMGNHIYTQCQWGPVGDAAMAIWDGTQTPEEAMNAAQTAIEACVADIGPPAGRLRRPPMH